jgi:universal stress protein F
MYSRILVPIDTSHKSDHWQRAPLTAAGKLAEKLSGVIHVMSVVPNYLLDGDYPDLYTEDVASATRRKLEEMVEKHCLSNANVDISVEEGGICPQILRVAREQAIDAIVMASHWPLIKDYILGSRAAHVALHAPCSVFVIRGMH